MIRPSSRFSLGFLVLSGSLAGPPIGHTEQQQPVLPAAPKAEHFQALRERSPFTRPLDLSDTLVLTGVAQVNGKPLATLLDTEDGLSMAISEAPNDRGWKMVKLQRIDDLEAAVATIAVGSGDVIHVRHDRERIQSTAQRFRFKAKARAQMAEARERERNHMGNGPSHGVPAERVAMLRKIDQNDLPQGYNPGAGRNSEESHRLHQSYVDNRMAGMSDRQRGRVGQMWKEKQAVDPRMSNRGASFVRIMEHVAENEPR